MRHVLLLCVTLTVVASLAFLFFGCDGGLEPPREDRNGAIHGIIQYQGTWPPADSVRDLRLVAMRFVPRDTSDLLELNRLAISDRLSYGATAETVVVGGVRPGVFVYTGVAVNYAESIFAWRPIAVFEENDGVFEVRPADTAYIRVNVDFSSRPPFPPEP